MGLASSQREEKSETDRELSSRSVFRCGELDGRRRCGTTPQFSPRASEASSFPHQNICHNCFPSFLPPSSLSVIACAPFSGRGNGVKAEQGERTGERSNSLSSATLAAIKILQRERGEEAGPGIQMRFWYFLSWWGQPI